MTNFQIAIKHVLANEGELEVNPADPGGITKFGISLRFLRSIDAKKYGVFNVPPTDDDIRRLTIEQATQIYFHEFWSSAPFDKIENEEIAVYLFDCAVNLGIAPAIKILQRACWATFKDQSILMEDGILGEKTLNIVNTYLSYLDDILAAMRSERAGDYRLIVAEKPDKKVFLDGWLKRSYEK